jgi:hypothetical protein
MALAISCPTCETVRVPNARFCHGCGGDYEPEDSEPREASDLAGWVGPSKVEVTIAFGTAVQLGIGVAIGWLLVGLAGLLILYVAIGSPRLASP